MEISIQKFENRSVELVWIDALHLHPDHLVYDKMDSVQLVRPIPYVQGYTALNNKMLELDLLYLWVLQKWLPHQLKYINTNIMLEFIFLTNSLRNSSWSDGIFTSNTGIYMQLKPWFNSKLYWNYATYNFQIVYDFWL